MPMIVAAIVTLAVLALVAIGTLIKAASAERRTYSPERTAPHNVTS